MKLVLIHGIAQGGKSAAELREQWLAALRQSLSDPQRAALESVDVRVPFYGDTLDHLVTLGNAASPAIRARGPGADDLDELDSDETELVLEILARAQVSGDEVQAQLPVGQQERGPGNLEWLQAAARALSNRFPRLAEAVFKRFVPEVATYLRLPDRIDDLVRAEIEGGGSQVVVAHSLGSVVGYRVLRTLTVQPTVPLFVTLGSPLALPVIRRQMSPPTLGKPAGITTWLNAVDERDGAALFSRLDRDTFAAGIENMTDLHNDVREHPHKIDGYLHDAEVARRIADALGLG